MKVIENDTPKPAEKTGGVQSVERCFRLLELIGNHPDGINLADLSKESGLHTSTTFHIVKTIEKCGYARQSAQTKKYSLGPKVTALAAQARSGQDIQELAIPILKELSSDTGESSHFAALRRGEIVIEVQSPGYGIFQLKEQTGETRPAHATAIGKVILAHESAEVIENYLDTHPMDSFTPNTVTNRETLEQELKQVAQQGFAFDDSEYNEEARCIALRVYGQDGKVAGAIGVSAPVWRLNMKMIAEVSAKIGKAADKMSAALGYDAPPSS